MHIPASLSTALLLGARLGSAACLAYGIDIQGGGTYFQNVSSPLPFTFVSEFAGCENDVANNILVDPNGDEHSCTDTPLQPDNTPELSTCSLNKDQLYSGDWSLLIVSNNGDGHTDCDCDNHKRSHITKYYYIYSDGKYHIRNNHNCRGSDEDPQNHDPPEDDHDYHKSRLQTHDNLPPRQPGCDPVARITPTLVHAAALESAASKVFSGYFDSLSKLIPRDREQRIAERKARLAAGGRKNKRSIDSATVTVNDPNTADWPTTTVTMNAPNPSTMPVTVYATTTITSFDTITVEKGKTTLPTVTFTGSTSTQTKVVLTSLWVTKTVTKTPTVEITTTVTPSGGACKTQGGHYY